MNKSNYKFTVEISFKAHSDESAYAQLIEQLRPLWGLCIQTVGCEVNGKAMSEGRFEKIKDDVLSKAD